MLEVRGSKPLESGGVVHGEYPWLPFFFSQGDPRKERGDTGEDV